MEAVSADVVVVVDVLRFTTAVDAAVSRGIAVHPYRWRDDGAARLAASVGAVLADGSPGAPSLSPGSLLDLPMGSAVVLPSPNGSTCAALAAERGATVVAACLRNSAAVAAWLSRPGRRGDGRPVRRAVARRLAAPGAGGPAGGGCGDRRPVRAPLTGGRRRRGGVAGLR